MATMLGYDADTRRPFGLLIGEEDGATGFIHLELKIQQMAPQFKIKYETDGDSFRMRK